MLSQKGQLWCDSDDLIEFPAKYAECGTVRFTLNPLAFDLMLTSICVFDLDGLARSDFMPSRFAVFKAIIWLTTTPEKLGVLQ